MYLVGTLRLSRPWQPVRSFSTLSSTKWVELRMASGSHSSINQLEERANDEYDNPQTQAKYLEVPLWVYHLALL